MVALSSLPEHTSSISPDLIPERHLLCNSVTVDDLMSDKADLRSGEDVWSSIRVLSPVDSFGLMTGENSLSQEIDKGSWNLPLHDLLMCLMVLVYI